MREKRERERERDEGRGERRRVSNERVSERDLVFSCFLRHFVVFFPAPPPLFHWSRSCRCYSSVCDFGGKARREREKRGSKERRKRKEHERRGERARSKKGGRRRQKTGAASSSHTTLQKTRRPLFDAKTALSTHPLFSKSKKNMPIPEEERLFRSNLLKRANGREREKKRGRQEAFCGVIADKLLFACLVSYFSAVVPPLPVSSGRKHVQRAPEQEQEQERERNRAERKRAERRQEEGEQLLVRRRPLTL